MTKKKTKGLWILKLLGILFVVYISLTIDISTGYYEAKLSEKTTITEEAMQRFEEDVRNGKDVDITDYVTDIRKDYSNGTTKAGVMFSQTIETVMSKGINGMLKVFKSLFTWFFKY